MQRLLLGARTGLRMAQTIVFQVQGGPARSIIERFAINLPQKQFSSSVPVVYRRPNFKTFSSAPETEAATGGGGKGRVNIGGGYGGNGGGGGGGGGSSKSGGPNGWWASYLLLLERNPIATKSITAGVLNGIGDIIAQLQFGDGKLNWKRLGIFSFVGVGLIGPTLHFWYGSLGRLITLTGTPGAMTRLALDQLAFAPIFISAIVASIMTLEGHGSEVLSKLKADLATMVKGNWTLWVPFQFINFRFVPGNLQVLAANVVALIWNIYLSFMAHKTEA